MTKNNQSNNDSGLSFKFRLDRKHPTNEFMTENLIYIDMQDKSIKEVVKLLNLSLRTAEQGLRIRQPSAKNFEMFKGKTDG